MFIEKLKNFGRTDTPLTASGNHKKTWKDGSCSTSQENGLVWDAKIKVGQTANSPKETE